MTKARTNRTPGPEDPGTDLATTEQTAGSITPAELPVMRSLGIPAGFRDIRQADHDVMAGILAEIAAAGSVEAALKLGVSEAMRDHVGESFRFLDFKYQPSDYDPAGWPYVVTKAEPVNPKTGETGEAITLTGGAKSIVAMLALARKTDGLPFVAKIEEQPFETDEGEARRTYKLVPTS